MRRPADGRRPRPRAAAAPIFLLMLAVACGPAACRRGRAPGRPNVVLVVIDTLRPDHLPCYGYRVNTAPFLTGLAGRGAVFEDCTSASSFTSPATASLLTSLYPFQHGVLKGMIVTLNQQSENPTLRLNRIPEAALTLGEWLRGSGYRTYAVADNINICEAEGFSQGFDRFVTLNNRGADQVNRQALLWKKEMRAKAPYFLYLHYMDPHAPYLAREPWYVSGGDELRDQQAKYDSEIRFVDERLREMFAAFSWDEDTVLIVTSDHGEEFLEHGQTGHGKTLYNEVLRVPLLIWSPGLLPGPRRLPQAVSSLDIMPTVGAMLGLKAGGDFAGVSLWPCPGPNVPTEPRTLFAQLLASRPGGADSALRATIRDGWKLIVTDELFRELYDTRRHPRELVNQFGRGDASALADRLNGLFLSFKTRARVLSQERDERKIDAKLLEELKTLGYVQ